MKNRVLKHIVKRLRLLKWKRKCTMPITIDIDGNSTFEGNNAVRSHTVLNNAHLGFGSYVGDNCVLVNCRIGKFCSIANNVRMIYGQHPTTYVSTHPAFYSTMGQVPEIYVTENKFEEYKYVDSDNKIAVEIGNDVWIGEGVKIMEGVTIGDGVIVAAGSIVTRDIPPYAVVGGIPGKIMRYRFGEEEIIFLEEVKWWDKPREWLENYAQYFDNIQRLMQEVKDNGRV